MTTPPATPVCPYCRSPFTSEETITPCPACGTPHHADCFAENGGCTVFGCTAAPADEPKLSILATDLHPPPTAYSPAPSTSIYNLAAFPAPPPQNTAPAPPPLPPGTIPPPPTPFYTAPQAFPAYGYGGYVRPKSRVAFVLLAVFLGSFGAHNFYAGYNRKATVQLCLTPLHLFLGIAHHLDLGYRRSLHRYPR